METDDPFDFWMEFVKNVEFLWNTPESFNHNDVGFVFGDFTVNIIIIIDLNKNSLILLDEFVDH